MFHAASSEEIDAIWSHVLRVNNHLLRQDTSSRVVCHRPGLKMFLEHCCQERSYCFSIKKCGNVTCSICSPPQLPVEVFNTLHHLPDPVPDITGEHYQDFEQLYGTATSERYRPSLTEKSRKSHGMPFQPNAQFARCVGMTLQCCECIRPRVLYSQRKLKYYELSVLKEILSIVAYSCGSLLCELVSQETSSLHRELIGRVFVKANLTCSDKVETAYYSSELFEDVCIHYGSASLISREEAVDILPTCDSCFRTKPKAFKHKQNQMQPASKRSRTLSTS